MNKLLIFLIIFIISISIGCNKTPQYYEISGNVKKFISQESISGANIYLDAKKLENGIYNSSFTNINNTQSKTDGTYFMDFEEETVSEYRFRVSKEGFFDYEVEVSVDELQSSFSYKKDFTLYEVAWIELKVKNTTPQAIDDEINYRFINIAVSGKDCCSNEQIQGIGPAYSATNLCRSQSDEWIKIEWVVKKNGSQHIYYDSVWTEANKTVTKSINY